MGLIEKCCICGNKNCKVGVYKEVINHLYFSCESCGKYILPVSSPYLTNTDFAGKDKNNHKMGEFLFHNKKKGGKYFIGEQKDFDKFLEMDPIAKFTLITNEQVNSWYPNNLVQMIDLIVLYLNKEIEYLGQQVNYDYYKLSKVFFINIESQAKDIVSKKVIDQIRYIQKYLKDVGYIDTVELSVVGAHTWTHGVAISLTPKGLERCYDLQKSENKDVFVAMSFHESAKDIRNAIKQGIDNARYSSLLMDEIVHNHQIVPEMLRLIKESRLMIMDITYPNFGAYYEAGYAQGLGKEVIITCKREVWNQKEFICEKDDNCRYIEIASKPHFDIVQKQILVWDDYADLTKKLEEWIKHLVG